MPWKEQRLETMREEFVKRVLQHEKSKSALCKEYGISRPTGDKWIERYLANESLSDQSRAPKFTPHKTKPETEAMGSLLLYSSLCPAACFELRKALAGELLDAVYIEDILAASLETSSIRSNAPVSPGLSM